MQATRSRPTPKPPRIAAQPLKRILPALTGRDATFWVKIEKDIDPAFCRQPGENFLGPINILA
jgi:hypothetical protein